MLLALLAACPAVPEKDGCPTCPVEEGCADLVAPPVAACFGGGDLDYPGYGTLEADVEGRVVSIAAGSRPDACLVDVGNAQVGEGVVVVVEDGEGLQYTVSFDVPELADTLVAVDDVVHLTAAYTFGEFGPDVGVVSLTSEGGGIHALVEEAGSVDTLPSSIVTVTEGDVRCTEDDGCGVFSKYDMDVAVGDETVTVRYGEEAALEGGRVVSGGLERAAEDQGDVCPDWFVANVTLALVAD
jgi:hypothetical protein